MDDSHGNRDAIGLSGMSYDNTGQLGANTWRHVAFIEQVADRRPADARRRPARGDCGRTAGPAPSDHARARQPGQGAGQRAQRRGAGGVRPADGAVGRPGDPLADVVGRVQALHARRLPGRLPDRRAVPHRVRHRRRAGRHLQRLRLLRARLPVRGHRPAQGRRPGLQVHDVLRPADRRADAGLRDRVPDAVDPVRRPRRAAGAGRRPAGDAASRRASRRRGCTGGTRTTASGERGVLPAARRAGGLRAAAGPGRDHAGPAVDVAGRGRGRGDGRRGRGVGVRGTEALDDRGSAYRVPAGVGPAART